MTDSMAKAMVPLAGKPMVQWAAESLVAAGAQELRIGLGWLREATRSAVPPPEWPARSTLVDVPSYERGPLETLVRTCEDLETERVLVSPVDAVLSGEDLAGLVRMHQGEVTLAVDCASSSESRVFLNRSGQVQGIGEATGEVASECASAMAFVAEFTFLDRCRAALASGESRVVGVINQMIREDVPVRAYPVRSKWFDVDDVAMLLAATRHLLSAHTIQIKDHVFIPQGDAIEVGQGIMMESGIKMAKGVRLKGPVLIAGGCTLGADSVIGPSVYLDRGVTVGAGAHLAEAIAYAGSTIPDGSSLVDVVMFESDILRGGDSDSK
jgi:NDP-sugar pyrophosphorylase family protein